MLDHQLSMRVAGLIFIEMGLTVFVDLFTGVAVGGFLAILLTIQSITDIQVKDMRAITRGDNVNWLTPKERSLLEAAKGRVLMFHLSGPMSFGAAKSISRRMAIVENYEVLILDLTAVPKIGITALIAIETMIKDALAKRRDVFLVGAKGQVAQRLKRSEILQKLPPAHQVPERVIALERSLELICDYATPAEV